MPKVKPLGRLRGRLRSHLDAIDAARPIDVHAGIIKMKREPDRKGEGLPEPELGLKEALSDVGADSASESAALPSTPSTRPHAGIDVPTVKYQQKRNFNGKEDDDSSSNGIFKMKRGIGKPLGFE